MIDQNSSNLLSEVDPQTNAQLVANALEKILLGANNRLAIKALQTNKPLSKVKACEYIGISIPTLDKWIQRGYLAVVMIDGRKFITEEAIQKCMRQHEYLCSKPLHAGSSTASR